MHGCFFRAGRAAVDADIAREKARLLVGMRPLILRDQAAGPGIGLVIGPVLVLVLVLGLGLGIGVGLRLLLGEQLVERLARPFLRQRGAKTFAGRPPVWRDDPGIQRVIPRVAVQRVRRVQRSVIFKVVRGVVDLVIGHVWSPPPRRGYSAGSWGQASEHGPHPAGRSVRPASPRVRYSARRAPLQARSAVRRASGYGLPPSG